MNELVVSGEKTFGRAIFGLNRNEVYEYLNQVSSAYEELQLQIHVLKEQNNKLSDSNRDNALKIYNLQNDVTEEQRKFDKVNVELEAMKKENAALHRELEAAERRISKLTDELIKTGVEIEVEKKPQPVQAQGIVEEEKGFTPKPIFDEPAAPKQEKSGVKDIFAELKETAAKEAASEAAKETVFHADSSDTQAAGTGGESGVDTDEDEVYAGEVEVKVDESMLIGNDDDDDEGFTFL